MSKTHIARMVGFISNYYVLLLSFIAIKNIYNNVFIERIINKDTRNPRLINNLTVNSEIESTIKQINIAPQVIEMNSHSLNTADTPLKSRGFEPRQSFLLNN